MPKPDPKSSAMPKADDCKCAFLAEAPIACIREVAADAISGDVSTETVKKALWAGGCLLEVWQPTDAPPDTPVFGANREARYDEPEECGQELLSVCDRVQGAYAAAGKGQPALAALGPAEFGLIFSLLQQIIAHWLTRKPA